MDGKQLKNSILQWAIQGKLVPQNPKDEPAQKLLERIAASRNAGEKTKKKSTPTSRIYRENGVWYEQVGTATPKDISDEIPFEIPENWAWCRMGDIIEFVNGRAYKKEELLSKGKYKVLRVGNFFTNQSWYFSDLELPEDKYCYNGDLLYAWSASFGPHIWNGDKTIFHYHIWNLKYDKKSLYREYLYYFFLYDKKQIGASTTGSTMIHVSMEHMTPRLIPLPPLAEQKRIVAKLEQVLPLAEEYGAAQEQLDKLNKELPEALKKSILQEAIQGKLVPQNPKDEPAQKLLEKIALSRHSERSEESSKRSKKTSKDQTSRIYRENSVWYEQVGSATPKDISDEIPFEIPETWAWCRLGNCSDYAASKEKAKSFDDIQEMWSLDLEDIEKNSGRIVKRLKISERKIVGEKVVFKKGQVLYSKLRPYLKKILVAPEDGVCSSEIVPFSPFECLNASYLVTVLKSPHVDYTINLVTYGVKMPRVGTDTMLNLLIPIPPLAEQKRIVAKLEQLFKVL